MTKVAIITRTKDRSLFLARAIESVKNQTFDDYLHVIINDGGDQQAVSKVIDQYGEHAKQKIQLFHRENPSNAPDTIFNESIDRIDSEYVVIHDDDDTWHPEFLSSTVSKLDEGANGALVRTDKVVESVVNGRIVHQKSEHYLENVKAVSLYQQCIDNQLTPIAFLFRRSAYEAVGKYDASLPVIGDWEFGIRFLLKYDVEYLDPGYALAYYHHRKDSKDNSFSKHSHRYYLNKVANKYLREELAQGKLGPGYIMSKTRYEQSNLAHMVRKAMPGFVANRLKKRIQS